MSEDLKRRARAEARRGDYPGEVVRCGTPKPALYDDLTLLERLAHLTALCQRQASLGGTTKPPQPRSQWPGEVFPLGPS